jgi:hypothetical protein
MIFLRLHCFAIRKTRRCLLTTETILEEPTLASSGVGFTSSGNLSNILFLPL